MKDWYKKKKWIIICLIFRGRKQGYHEAKDLAKNIKIEEIESYHLACNEFLHRVIMKDCSKQANRVINRETVIFDCTGMGWRRKCFFFFFF